MGILILTSQKIYWNRILKSKNQFKQITRYYILIIKGWEKQSWVYLLNYYIYYYYHRDIMVYNILLQGDDGNTFVN